MNLYTSVFAYVCSIGLYNGIVNADTQNVRIANADGQKKGVKENIYPIQGKLRPINIHCISPRFSKRVSSAYSHWRVVCYHSVRECSWT